MYTTCIQTVSLVQIRIDQIRLVQIIYGESIGKEGQKEGQDETEKEIWEEQFEKFYKEYPKKVKKQNVKKWFEKNKPSSELFSSIMSRLEQFRGSKDWLKDNGQYIPYPSTWLNQRRWEDEEILEKGTELKGIKLQQNNFVQRQYGNLDYLYANGGNASE